MSSRDLVRALDRLQLADWVVVERDQELAVVDSTTKLARAERRTRWQIGVAEDAPAGRGLAHVAVDAVDGSADEVVAQAVALARAALGPAWPTLPQAAPAKMELVDPAIAARDPIAIAHAIVDEHARPPNVAIAATVLRERVSAQTRQGMHVDWTASAVRAELLVGDGERSLDVVREARRIADLDARGAIDSAIADLVLRAHAGGPVPGPCALVLENEALLHGGLGVWQAIVAQADAVLVRQGLARYRIGEPIVAGASELAEPLTIDSDGARAFGLLSAPIGDDGEAVRRFTIIDRGIAVGLGLSPREAALRHAEPNGGVRNLVVAAGKGATVAAKHRELRVRRLRDLAIDPYTGDATLEIALGVSGDNATPFTGGTVRLDLIAALARARRAIGTIARGAYVGPSAITIDDVELVA